MLQDFANQVYWWKDYTAACRKAGKNKGVFATPDIAERMAGQVYMFYLLIMIIKTNINKLPIADFTNLPLYCVYIYI